MADAAERAADRFLEYYERVRQIYLDDRGVPLEEYKPTEPKRLTAVFRKLLASDAQDTDLVADVLHALVGAQCLGNGNHRASMLFLEGVLSSLGVPFPWYADEPDAEARFGVAVENFSDSSHRLIDRQAELGYNRQQLKAQHRTMTREWVERHLGDQSRVATMIDPQRLMAFSS